LKGRTGKITSKHLEKITSCQNSQKIKINFIISKNLWKSSVISKRFGLVKDFIK